MTRTSFPIGIYLFAFAAGVVALFIGALLAGRLIYFRSTTGTIRYEPLLTRGGTIIRPTVSYTREGGSFGLDPSPKDLPAGFKEGDTVTVLYEPYGTGAIIATPRLWLHAALTSLAGALLIAGSRLLGSGRRFLDSACGHKIWAQNILLLSLATLTVACVLGIWAVYSSLSYMAAVDIHNRSDSIVWQNLVGVATQFTGFAAFCGFGLGVSALGAYQLIKRRWFAKLGVSNSA